jgi:hypothetical protein
MEQEITHYSRGKLHVGQITVRESAYSTNLLFEIGALLHIGSITTLLAKLRCQNVVTT